MNICSVPNCGVHVYCNAKFCNRHYNQLRLHGKILETTKFDKNKFFIDGVICWIILCNNKCIEIARAKIYTIYYEILKDYKWHLTNKGYVEHVWYDQDGQHQMTLHGAIIELSSKIVKAGEEIDHKDGDKLNCLDDNLRICNHLQNSRNRKTQKNKSSKYKGVTWYKSYKNWKAYIKFNGKLINLGYYLTENEAAQAYNEAAIKYFGEFAQLNIIE